jgi:hypothetical protein
LLVWRKKLLNEVAPRTALVSETGKYVVTFDDWPYRGIGNKVIVIYDSLGKLKKNGGLKEISPFLFGEYQMTFSSILWCKSVEIIGEAILRIVFISKDNIMSIKRYNMRTLEFEELVEPDIGK